MDLAAQMAWWYDSTELILMQLISICNKAFKSPQISRPLGRIAQKPRKTGIFMP
jgi:hypothetical protein